MRILRRFGIILLIGLLSISILPAHAAPLTVTDCTASAGAAGRLADVIASASSGDTISFSCGPAVIPFSAKITISQNISIDGANSITFDGGGITSHFEISAGFTVTMNNLILQNGAGFSGFTGSIYNFGTLNLNGVTFTSNVGGDGGAFNNQNIATLTNVTFSNNQGSYGGAVFNSTAGTATFNNVTFSNNSANNAGGGLRNRGNSTLNGGSFSNNTGPGGAINSVTGSVTSQNITYTSNTCLGTITDNGGNFRDAASTGCPGTVLNVALSASAVCNNATLEVTITAGDGNFDIIASSITLHANVGTGTHTYNGPLTFSNITIVELSGDMQSVDVGSLYCHNPLVTSAVCMGADLQVTITSGDGNFVISADSATLHPSAPIGTHTFTGPRNETNLSVRELGGLETLNLGDFNCFASSTLTATAVCNGADLEVTISNGNAPFSISVTDSNGVMNSGGNPLGVYTFTGPDTFSNIGITEDSGDLETITIPSVTCTAPVTPPVVPAPVVLSPDTTALGCDVTSMVENAPDNTYCRLLMKDGGVVNYAGAVPQNLIDLGVILAVDVYRLQGGQSITDFGGYSQICLAGEGRLFYLDARTSPRTQVELATESVDGFTCGWIPAAGTIVLTQ